MFLPSPCFLLNPDIGRTIKPLDRQMGSPGITQRKFGYHLFFFATLLTLTNCRNATIVENTHVEGGLLFSKHCSSCHGLEEDGFGPPLGGITSLLSEKQLLEFIRNPTAVLESGDVRAMALRSRYKQEMPAFSWLESYQIHSILAYIKHQSQVHDLKVLSLSTDSVATGLTGRLVEPVKKSALKIEMEEIIRIPQIPGSSPDLGIVTLRAHPSADGTLIVSDQDGILYHIRRDEANIFLDLRAEVPDFQSGPGIATGVASFDFHPDYLNNGLLYILYAETYKGQIADYAISDSIKSEVQWVLSEWKMDDIENLRFIGTHRQLLRLHAPTFGHGAQDLLFNQTLDKTHPDYGMLYFGYGDGGSCNIGIPDFGHHLKSFLGTILRINPAGNNSRNKKYGIPGDNPFANKTDPETVKEIFAYGFRNPHRLTWDPTHENRLIATDIGEANIEEINIVEKGGDYGWPRREGNYGIITTKDLKTVYKVPGSDQHLYRGPFAQYDHEDGFAISGGFVSQGDLTLLNNKYVFGDIVNGKLFYTNIDLPLSDSSIYELTIMENGQETNLQEISQTKRVHLRIGYDQFSRHLFVITKCDGSIRRITNAYY